MDLEADLIERSVIAGRRTGQRPQSSDTGDRGGAGCRGFRSLDQEVVSKKGPVLVVLVESQMRREPQNDQPASGRAPVARVPSRNPPGIGRRCRDANMTARKRCAHLARGLPGPRGTESEQSSDSLPSRDSLPSALDSHQICACRRCRQAPAGSCDCSPSPPVEIFTPRPENGRHVLST